MSTWDAPDPPPADRATDVGDAPVVSISDVHGYLDQARSALLAVGETARFDPVVTADADERLHWADNDYVLVFNGDLVDRGGHNEATVDLALRLIREAPPGRVRYHLGNHEMAILCPDVLEWPGTYSQELPRERRRSFVRLVADGVVTAAFAGHTYTYSHAGAADGVDAAAANETARQAARDLLDAMDAGRYGAAQRALPRRYDDVFGLDGRTGRGADAGVLWMDFRHMAADAPPQVVGHTRQTTPTRRGRVVCGNVIRETRGSPGGETALVETPDGLAAVARRADGGVAVTEP